MSVTPSAQTVCLSCRFRFLAGLRSSASRGFLSTLPPRSQTVYRISRGKQGGNRRYISTSIARCRPVATEPEAATTEPPLESVPSPETAAQNAWQRYGGSLPKDFLSPEEYRIYERLYGVPRWVEQSEKEADGEDALAGVDEDGLGSELGEEMIDEEELQSAEEEQLLQDSFPSRDTPTRAEQAAAVRLREDIQRAIDADPEYDPEEEEEEEDAEEEEDIEDEEPSVYSSTITRAHPLTTAGKFSTSPATIHLPHEALTGPVSSILRASSNKHISQIAHRELGGPGLPYSPATPTSGRHLPQTPIRLQASQSQMGEIEGDVFLAAIMPGTYAAVMSVLVEVRKRLGSEWLRGLLNRKGGPRVLDAGGGGVGIIAWREILKAEWKTMEDEHSQPQPNSTNKKSTVPLGTSTIITGSAALRHRASRFLNDNATFLPRLPDYVHATPDVLEGITNPSHRKQYDVILAPHTLWPLHRDHQRKFHVENLWSLLNPDGGVLVLIEKGLPKGFEAIAGARNYLLKHHIPSSSDDDHVHRGDGVVEGRTEDDEHPGIPGEETKEDSKKEGMIIAPCTNHFDCPMSNKGGGQLKSRKTWCHFEQRYQRPQYLQRIIGATHRNHEDVKFSYLAVMKGRDERHLYTEEGGVMGGGGVLLKQGDEASDASFAGIIEEEVEESTDTSPPRQSQFDNEIEKDDQEISTPSSQVLNERGEEDDDDDVKRRRQEMWTHPRTLLPPLKRQGHVLLDVCTPSGKLERWTIPKSFGRQAYRDARKSKWGDIWCLGGKTRIPRIIRGGRGDGVEARGGGSAKGTVRVENAKGGMGTGNGKRNRKERREMKRERKRGERRRGLEEV
ncbi:MAG: hypothetical protein M1823_005507 [Watsoniomyces obsoletus]|nr:MAG: hypothetical protein M1823_005507 [Watsoniomyces obsoletus]